MTRLEVFPAGVRPSPQAAAATRGQTRLERGQGWFRSSGGGAECARVGRLHPDYYPLLIYDRIMGLPSGPLLAKCASYGLAYSVGSGMTTFQ